MAQPADALGFKGVRGDGENCREGRSCRLLFDLTTSDSRARSTAVWPEADLLKIVNRTGIIDVIGTGGRMMDPNREVWP